MNKYLTVTEPEKFWTLDIETNGLQPDKVWCAVFLNKATRQVVKLLDKKDIKDFIEQRKDHTFCGHNLISFDWYWLSVLCGFNYQLGFKIDTLILSYLYNPALEGGHSLEEYGIRLKFPKKEYSDWSKYTPAMLEYCKNDVFLAEKVYDALTTKMNKIGYSELSCYIEHETREIIDQQERNGIYFFTDRATGLLSDLKNKQANISESVHKIFPPKLEELGTYTRRFRKDGNDFASYERHFRDYPLIKDNEDGTYTTYNYNDFNIGSSKQRLDRLLELGFEPREFTKKGNPKVDEDALVLFAKECGRPEVQAMSEWLVLQGRITMLYGNDETGSKGWLKYVTSDHRIHGKLLTCAATSRRMIHSKPNTGNVPHPLKSRYGKEMRSCWGVEPDKGLKQVGTDASGLENVGLLHYLNNPKAEKVLNQKKPNDIHSMNARKLTEILGRPIDREWGAKTSYYAWMYGAYPPKLGQIVKGNKFDGEKVRDVLAKSVPGLQKLIDEITDEYESNNGLIKCVDGGFVRPFSTGSCLNYRIQSLGAVVMKLAAIRLKQLTIEKGLFFKQLLTVHDEWQKETKEKDAEELGRTAVIAIEQAAEELNFNVKLSGEYKIGDNWAETH